MCEIERVRGGKNNREWTGAWRKGPGGPAGLSEKRNMRDRDKKRDEWLEKESCEIKARPEAQYAFASLVQE